MSLRSELFHFIWKSDTSDALYESALSAYTSPAAHWSTASTGHAGAFCYAKYRLLWVEIR